MTNDLRMLAMVWLMLAACEEHAPVLLVPDGFVTALWVSLGLTMGITTRR